jgi:P27 family predicted phage terminase small subunit
MARPRKPTHLKIVAGTAQPCRTNKAEPKPERQRPSPPAHLSDRAKVAWGAVSVMLDRMGILTEADSLALESLCCAYADLVDARTSLKSAVSHGDDELAAAGALTYVTVGKAGPMIRSRPELALIADADRRVAMWLAKFGLTPADRSRVSATDAGEASPWDEMFGS